MRNFPDTPGFGDGEPTVADIQRMQDAAEAEEARRAEAETRMREPDADEPSPMFTAIASAGVTGFIVTAWFLLLALCHAGHWSAAEVTAPLWGLLLLGAAATLVVAIALGAVDAWDAHCLRRAIRRDGRP